MSTTIMNASSVYRSLGDAAGRLRSASDVLEEHHEELSSPAWSTIFLLRDVTPMLDKIISEASHSAIPAAGISREAPAGRDDLAALRDALHQARAVFVAIRELVAARLDGCVVNGPTIDELARIGRDQADRALGPPSGNAGLPNDAAELEVGHA